MKIIRQIMILLLFSMLGELLHCYIPLPIPANIYGMVLLFFSLLSGILKPESIHEIGNFLLEIMPLLFVPAGVGLMASWGILSRILLPLVVIITVSTILVMGVSGSVTQWVILHQQHKKQETGRQTGSREETDL